jgi:hypothetical protein
MTTMFNVMDALQDLLLSDRLISSAWVEYVCLLRTVGVIHDLIVPMEKMNSFVWKERTLPAYLTMKYIERKKKLI